MAPLAPHDQLRCARLTRGEEPASLAARTGLRVHHILAIEEGRFADLPPGIYGRAAIRSFAAAYALDADTVLAACEALLPVAADPIEELARLRGIAPPPHAAAVQVAAPAVAAPEWRPFAAAVVDGAIAGALLGAASGGAALLARVSVAALSPSALALFVLLGSAYYLWLGGLGGTTLGEYAVGPRARHRDPRPLTLRAIARRAAAAATADARAIHALGMRVGSCLTPRVGRSVQPPAPSPLPPRSRDREEALTWSMSRQASVPPPPLRPRRG